MPQEVPQEVETGALPDKDEVGVAVGEVGRGRETLGTAGTRAAHAGRVDGQELSVDHTPTLILSWCFDTKKEAHKD